MSIAVGVGKKRLARIVNEEAKKFGWVVSLNRGGKVLKIFLRPRSDEIDLNNYHQRFVTAVQAMHAIQKRLVGVLAQEGRIRDALILFPVIPIERSRKVGVLPLRLGIFVPRTSYERNKNNKGKIVGVDAGGVLLPLKYYFPKDLSLLSLLTGKGHLIGNSVQESLASLYLSNYLNSSFVARNVYVTKVYPDTKNPNGTKPHYSRSLGILETEFDGIFLDKHSTPHIVEAKTAPEPKEESTEESECSWEKIVISKMRSYEQPLLRLKRAGVNATLHFVVTSIDHNRAKEFAERAAEHISKMHPVYPTIVHGVHVSENGPRQEFLKRINATSKV